jgi:AcrR family transcriptional regulator
MPKVSEDYLTARRRQILDAALVCFARRGFHGTPMHAIFEEAGLSPGAVYRYFKSKEEIVEAIATETLSGFAVAMQSRDSGRPDEVLGRLLDAIEAVELRDQRLRLALQIWGEAMLNPRLGSFVREVIGRLEQRVAAELDVADPDATARVLVAIAQGSVVQRNLDEDYDPERFRRAARALLSQAQPASRLEG